MEHFAFWIRQRRVELAEHFGDASQGAAPRNLEEEQFIACPADNPGGVLGDQSRTYKPP